MTALKPQKYQSFSFSGGTHHPISSTPLPRVTKPLTSQKMQITDQTSLHILLAQQQTPLVFRKSSSTQGKLSSSPGATSNQWSNIEDLLSDPQGSLNIQNLATKLNNSNYRQLKSSHLQPSSQENNTSFASTQQLNSTELETLAQEVYHLLRHWLELELETLAQEVYHRLRHRLELDRERHGFHSGRLPW